jgi:superfamily II DNA/RNA helicase
MNFISSNNKQIMGLYFNYNMPQNLITQSQSGTGKTAAFVLTMLSRVDPSEHYPQVLCLSPTYELAIQTGKVIQTMSKFCPQVSVIFAVKQETRM